MFDVTNPVLKANPYPTYAQLRATTPVVQAAIGGKRTAWLLTRYDDALALLRDQRFAKNPLNAQDDKQRKTNPWVPKFVRPLMKNMLDLDAPDHTRLRALVQKAFTPRLVEELRPRIEQLTAELLHNAQRNGQIELLESYALPVPLTIIGELFGVPASKYADFHRWTSKILNVSSTADGLKVLPALWSLMRFLRDLVAQRRIDPRDDLTTALVQANENGDVLSEDEMIAMMFLLLSAGHETTVNLIGSGTLALIQHPEQRERLRENPALIKTAIEELVRFVSPVDCTTERYAREDLTIGDVQIRRGEMVLACIGSANHDESRFEHPDVLDLGRDPNRHLSFGLGAHYCIGAPLARLEAQIAMTTIVEQLPTIRLSVAPDRLRWRKHAFLRGLQALPLSV